jgi:hypothetical protein
MTSVSARILALSFSCTVLSTPVVSAQDLSKYREFQLGMSLAAVAQKTGVTAVTQVPPQSSGLIQELRWQPADGLAASPPRDSVRKVLLSFFNGELFRIAVSYDWERTEGLTVEDMIAALTSTYGPPITPDSDLIPLLSRSSSGSDKIVAHWEDTQYSINLVRPSYASTFGLVMLSKRLDALARAAMVEAIWLDDQQSLARAIGRKRSLEDQDHVRQDQARTRNKATFRP